MTTGSLTESPVQHERFIALAPDRLHTGLISAASMRLKTFCAIK